MATIPLKTITFPGLDNTYTVPQLDDTLSIAGKAADAGAVRSEITRLDESEATKANIDGSYEQMTVGNAEQLVSSIKEEDKVPYIFRTSGGSIDIGDREEDKIIGGTVAWNQLVKNGNFADTSEWTEYNTSISASANVLSISVTSASLAVVSQSVILPLGHKFIYSFEVKGDEAYSAWMWTFGAEESYQLPITTSWVRNTRLLSKTTNNVNLNIARKTSPLTSEKIYMKNIVLFDLTQMFGTAIADRAYALEQTTAGSGIAWLKSMGFFTKDYYPYDAGSLKSVEGLTAHSMVGFNQLDSVTNYYSSVHFSYNDGTLTNILADTNANGFGLSLQVYYKAEGATSPYVFVREISAQSRSTATGIRTQNFSLRYEDVQPNYYVRVKHNGASLDLTMMYVPTETLLPNVTYCISMNVKSANPQTVGGLVVGDLCINLSWDGERDGEYEPYVKHSYPLDSTLTLRGIPKLDANNSLYYDGDTYESDGTVTRRYGVVDLGTLSWGYSSADKRFFTTSINDLKYYPNSSLPNIITTKYNAVTFDYFYNSPTVDKTIAVYNANYLFIRELTLTDATVLKNRLSGVYLVYELVTPTTEEAAPYTNPQIVDDFGTEEYVIDNTVTVPIPVGHDTFYQANLVAKLEMAPNSPNGDGDYIVRQTNGENAYVPITFPADELPAAPTTDGNYVLKCTVASGTATFTWEAQS